MTLLIINILIGQVSFAMCDGQLAFSFLSEGSTVRALKQQTIAQSPSVRSLSNVIFPGDVDRIIEEGIGTVEELRALAPAEIKRIVTSRRVSALMNYLDVSGYRPPDRKDLGPIPEITTQDWINQTPLDAEWIFAPGVLTRRDHEDEGRPLALVVDHRTNEISAVLINARQLFATLRPNHQPWRLTRTIKNFAHQRRLDFFQSNSDELKSKLKFVVRQALPTLPRVAIAETLGSAGNTLMSEALADTVRVLHSRDPSISKEIVLVRLRQRPGPGAQNVR